MTAAPDPVQVPPEKQTIGQLVADALRFYGDHVLASLALGIGPAALTVAAATLPRDPRVITFAVGWPLVMTLSFVSACFIVSGTPFGARRFLVAGLVGLVVAIPVPLLVTLIVLPAVLWLAIIGLAVPAAVREGTGVRASIRRGFSLGRADAVHSLGTIATLVLLVVVTQLMLYQLLHGLSGQAAAVAAFLASMLITPVLFIGAALLYDHQVARAAVKSEPRT